MTLHARVKAREIVSSTSSPIKTVGYIGLGNAGFSMASNLPRHGFHLVVHDADASKAARAAKEWPNTVSASSSDGNSAFRNCDMVITMLPHGKIVREVLLGNSESEGIAKFLKHGTIIVDTSSSSPFDTRALGKELEQSEQGSLRLVDSPITQTYMHATDAGESTLMVGSDSEEVYSRIKPVLQCMARYIFHMGPLGAGHAMKTLNNYIMASSIVALNDSLVTGQKFGLDPQKMIDVLNMGTGVNFPTLDTWRRDALTRNFASGFGLGLLVKDIGITKDFMEYNDFETELPDLIKKYLSFSYNLVEPGADHTEALKGWEKRSGVQLKETKKVTNIPREDFEQRLKGLNRP
ncbi:hypothetical protein LTR72_004914 [Exophiala xenobiotica]|nr:hypothetical protein LTR41_008761 [Exophiala xenobiotica]KAK5223528.1 hypothetical protein LTR72_004914 [Exophiala xenobiotica]